VNDRDRLLSKLLHIEALHAGATTDGERVAAESARERITALLKNLEPEEPSVEHRFRLNNEWSRKLFVALLRRYGIRPYRYSRQRHTTVMARIPDSFVDQTLWPEFLELTEALEEHLDRVTDDIISQTISSDTSEPEEVRALPHSTAK
jgi:hypothetical protein